MIAGFETLLQNISDFIATVVVPAFQTLKAWWDDNGPQIIAIVEGIRDKIVTVFKFIVDRIKWVIDNWDDLKTPMKVIATFMLR